MVFSLAPQNTERDNLRHAGMDRPGIQVRKDAPETSMSTSIQRSMLE